MNTDMTNRFETMEAAETRAAEMTESTGVLHVAVDSRYCFTPYEVVKMPEVGEEVSYAFNGDYTPCGKIAKISKTYKKITTDTGEVFWRKGDKMIWKRHNTWSLIMGHHYDRNPHF